MGTWKRLPLRVDPGLGLMSAGLCEILRFWHRSPVAEVRLHGICSSAERAIRRSAEPEKAGALWDPS